MLLHTRFVPDPDRCLLSSPCNSSTVVHLQIKKECLSKASTADTVSDALVDQDAAGRHGMQRAGPRCVPGEDAVPSAAFVRIQVVLPVGAPARWSLALTSCNLVGDFIPRWHIATRRPRYQNTRRNATSVSSASQYKVAEPPSSAVAHKVARSACHRMNDLALMITLPYMQQAS